MGRPAMDRDSKRSARRAIPLVGALERRVLMSAAKDWIYWEVKKPELGHVYRLQWKW